LLPAPDELVDIREKRCRQQNGVRAFAWVDLAVDLNGLARGSLDRLPVEGFDAPYEYGRECRACRSFARMELIGRAEDVNRARDAGREDSVIVPFACAVFAECCRTFTAESRAAGAQGSVRSLQE
jgi:hypothetical protein